MSENHYRSHFDDPLFRSGMAMNSCCRIAVEEALKRVRDKIENEVIMTTNNMDDEKTHTPYYKQLEGIKAANKTVILFIDAELKRLEEK